MFWIPMRRCHESVGLFSSRAAALFGVALLIALSVEQTGCGSSCARAAESSISVRLYDATTKAPLCDGEVFASDGERSARLEGFTWPSGDCPYVTFALGPGEYEVFVSHPRYESTRIHDVEVHEHGNNCGIDGAVRRVELVRSQ